MLLSNCLAYMRVGFVNSVREFSWEPVDFYAIFTNRAYGFGRNVFVGVPFGSTCITNLNVFTAYEKHPALSPRCARKVNNDEAI